ncbi:MAG: phosphatidate cytidylyltransferase, partial [Rhodanobacter sp.]
GAYFSGRTFGKRKLAPQISPGKTWAGAYGAMVAGLLVAETGGWLLGVRGAQLASLALLAAITVAVSIVGDLIESLMKRHAQVKDSGTIFPGHGGLMDRLDSVFAATPVFAAGLLLLGL